jgi:hypothetical protein
LPDPAYAYAPAWSNTLHVRVAGSAISSLPVATHHRAKKKGKAKNKHRRARKK